MPKKFVGSRPSGGLATQKFSRELLYSHTSSGPTEMAQCISLHLRIWQSPNTKPSMNNSNLFLAYLPVISFHTTDTSSRQRNLPTSHQEHQSKNYTGWQMWDQPWMKPPSYSKTSKDQTKENQNSYTTDSNGLIKTVYNINSTLIPPHIPKEPDLKRKKTQTEVVHTDCCHAPNSILT